MLSYVRTIAKNLKLLERNSQQNTADLKRKSGRDGEELVLQNLKQWVKNKKGSTRKKKKAFHIFEQPRIPDLERNRKSEIDLAVLCGNVLLMVEVKNWGGKVQSGSEGSWTQNPLGKNKQIKHHDPIENLQRKKGHLEDYLSKKKIKQAGGQSKSKKRAKKIRVQTILLFVSDSLELSIPKSQKQVCLFLDELESYLDKNLKLEAYNKDIYEAVEQLPTWDVVKLYGGMILTGDIVGARVEFGRDTLLNRREHATVDVFPARHFWQIFRRPFVKLSFFNKTLRKKFRCEMDQELTLLQAGSSKTTKIALHQIEKIQHGWQNDEYRRNPIEQYQGRWFNGEVVATESYGVFVKLDDLETGLLHSSSFPDPDDPPQIGDSLRVFVREVEIARNGKRRFGLKV